MNGDPSVLANRDISAEKLDTAGFLSNLPFSETTWTVMRMRRMRTRMKTTMTYLKTRHLVVVLLALSQFPPLPISGVGHSQQKQG